MFKMLHMLTPEKETSAVELMRSKTPLAKIANDLCLSLNDVCEVFNSFQRHEREKTFGKNILQTNLSTITQLRRI